MRVVLALLLVGFLVGCNERYDKENQTYYTCRSGVKYYRFAQSITPAFNRDGTLQLCEESAK